MNITQDTDSQDFEYSMDIKKSKDIEKSNDNYYQIKRGILFKDFAEDFFAKLGYSLRVNHWKQRYNFYKKKYKEQYKKLKELYSLIKKPFQSQKIKVQLKPYWFVNQWIWIISIDSIQRGNIIIRFDESKDSFISIDSISKERTANQMAFNIFQRLFFESFELFEEYPFEQF